MMADGMLMFMPLDWYLQAYPAPETAQIADFDYRITIDSYIDAYQWDWRLFRETESELDRMDDVEGFKSLEAGRYLLEINYSASHKGEGYSGASFIWLNVAE